MKSIEGNGMQIESASNVDNIVETEISKEPYHSGESNRLQKKNNIKPKAESGRCSEYWLDQTLGRYSIKCTVREK